MAANLLASTFRSGVLNVPTKKRAFDEGVCIYLVTENCCCELHCSIPSFPLTVILTYE